MSEPKENKKGGELWYGLDAYRRYFGISAKNWPFPVPGDIENQLRHPEDARNAVIGDYRNLEEKGSRRCVIHS